MANVTQRPHKIRPTTSDPAAALSPAARYVAAGVRIALGWIFLWAFLDKLFGWGFATSQENAWIDGGHPTQGFLQSSEGPFASFYHSIAGAAWADWLFMLGLLGIGIALILGIGMRVAATAASVLYVLMWSVVLPPPTNPFLDDHLILAGVVVLLALLGAGNTWGLGHWWSKTSLVTRQPWLK